MIETVLRCAGVTTGNLLRDCTGASRCSLAIKAEQACQEQHQAHSILEQVPPEQLQPVADQQYGDEAGSLYVRSDDDCSVNAIDSCSPELEFYPLPVYSVGLQPFLHGAIMDEEDRRSLEVVFRDETIKFLE